LHASRSRPSALAPALHPCSTLSRSKSHRGRSAWKGFSSERGHRRTTRCSRRSWGKPWSFAADLGVLRTQTRSTRRRNACRLDRPTATEPTSRRWMLVSLFTLWPRSDAVPDPACHGACNEGQAPRHASALDQRAAPRPAARLALEHRGMPSDERGTPRAGSRPSHVATSTRANQRQGHRGKNGCHLPLRGVEQQDAADEVRAPRWRPSLLILVFYGPLRPRGGGGA
jgi:hypothetical protein